ncbi:hypothetical protein DL96DRAFT_1049868 [Flagelloscypha sp. PMI_526]|nr:hypothetical protein DL96DRAFT_1049868 [Flagelloscypha sp. PMI_526]
MESSTTPERDAPQTGSSPSPDDCHGGRSSPAQLLRRLSQPENPNNVDESSRDAFKRDVLENHASFDHQKLIVAPFEQESANDSEFIQRIQAELLDATIEFYAWASARPRHEEQLALGRLEQGMQEVIAVEQEQGMSSFLISLSRSYFGMLLCFSKHDLSNLFSTCRTYSCPSRQFHREHEKRDCCSSSSFTLVNMLLIKLWQ